MNYHACENGGNSFVMKDNLEYMLKKVICYWLMVTITLGALTYFIFPKYTGVFILGLFIALSNFIINTIIIKFVLLRSNGKYGFIASISFTLRVLIICIIGLTLFTYNKFNVIAYMCGFCSYFICLVLYGVNTNN
jgi:ATP synthase protein I